MLLSNDGSTAQYNNVVCLPPVPRVLVKVNYNVDLECPVTEILVQTMFKIESYVTPILLSYVDKYVRDFKPADAQVSLWGGGVALHNLVLKADVLQQEVALPFTLVSGRIHELLIQVPWTKIMSEPIVVTIDTIECILSLRSPTPEENPQPESPSRKTEVVEAPPGYMQALVRRIVSNIALRVHHLIVKYVHDDIVLSLNVKHLTVDSAGANWMPAFADIEQNLPVIRRLVTLDDLTLCLDHSDSDGKIRFYQEPLLYRCKLELRVLTRLVSANTRRATSLSVHMRSSKLAWGVTNDQLSLLLRLMRERGSVEAKFLPPASKVSSTTQCSPLHAASLNSAEPTRSGSWSDWAWSWLPTWMDREADAEEAPAQPIPTPVYFTAYFDDISLVLKVMDSEGGGRKRARGILELTASYAAVKSLMSAPNIQRAKLGARALTLKSRGKCVCGHLDINAIHEESTIYLRRTQFEESEEWKWPEEEINDVIESAVAADEEYANPDEGSEKSDNSNESPYQPEVSAREETERKKADDNFWIQMNPFISLEFTHERSPPESDTNTYDMHVKIDFEYSDWWEESKLKVVIQPMELRVDKGLIHRVLALRNIFQQVQEIQYQDPPMRTLTVEECDALMDNIPQRRINVDIKCLRVRLYPWDHSLTERPFVSPLVLDLEVPRGSLSITGPLYPLRVCSAACQMPEDSGPLWQGARLHISGTFASMQVKICSPTEEQPKHCASTDLRFVVHVLLKPDLFTRRESILLSYSAKIREVNVSGSLARLQAASQIPLSIISEKWSSGLRYTTLAKDALNDEEFVAMDMTLEELSTRGFITKHVNTHLVTLHSARATALQSSEGDQLKQAWIFSAPDVPTTTPYLRAAVQWCSEKIPNSLDYIGIWTEPTAFSVDPLFISWLAYRPHLKPASESLSGFGSSRSMPSMQYFVRRRVTPPSSSGRGGSRSGSGAELVHVRARSAESSSETNEKKEPKQPPHQPAPPEEWWNGDKMLELHNRLRNMLINVELGLMLAYVTMSTVSAVDCATVRIAMERHATASNRVLAISFGRWSIHSNTSTKHLWQELQHDGPTFLAPKQDPNQQDEESFPWKLRLADVSCYILEIRAGTERSGRDKSVSGLRSQLKATHTVNPRTVLELVTTTVTLSVVTKSLQYKTFVKKPEQKKHFDPTKEEQRIKYFISGMDFKPTTLKEFVRGPARRKKSTPEEQPEPNTGNEPEHKVTLGPMVSIGIHIHADTPPIIVRLEHDQVDIVAATVHCFTHILTLSQRALMMAPRQGLTSQGLSQKSFVRSVSEMDEQRSMSDTTKSESRSDLIPIFEAHTSVNEDAKMKTFFWFQWVVSRATVVVTTSHVKLAFDIDDIISTVDLHEHYNQLKIKIASASVRHYERNESQEWTAGVLGGRVLEMREPTNAKEEHNFLAVTITQAQISNLPASWKEELHPKLVQLKLSTVDCMWEIYATLAPLEAVLQPKILDSIMSVVNEIAPRSFCPLHKEVKSTSSWQWPFCYVTAGGLRLLITSESESINSDDTFMFVIGKISVSPHPENPICRRPINTGSETSWMTVDGGYEGRQYEILIRNVAIRSAQFSQLVYQELSEAEVRGENPARKWTEPVVAPNITAILHAVDIGCVLAPALYAGDAIVCGPGIELNLVSDCAIELSIDQLHLLHRMAEAMRCSYYHHIESSTIFDDEQHGMCPYAEMLMATNTPEDMFGSPSEVTLAETKFNKIPSDIGRSTADSGVDTSSRSNLKYRQTNETSNLKKTVSIAFADQSPDLVSEYLEVYLTMGTIELSLYTVDDNSPEVNALKPEQCNVTNVQSSTPEPSPQTPDQELLEENNKGSQEAYKSRSLTETVRNVDIGKTQLDVANYMAHARKSEGNVPLLHLTLHQPNLYYYKKKTQKIVQVSLFNVWAGLGAGLSDQHWHAALLSTARGVPDPVTEIPPALATMKIVTPSAGGSLLSSSGTMSPRGTLRLDIERPVLLEVSEDRLRRLKGISELVQKKLLQETPRVIPEAKTFPAIYKLRRFMVNNSMDNATIQTTQIGLSGSEGTVSWDGASLQVSWSTRPDLLLARGSVSALLAATGPPQDSRHLLLQPLQLGIQLEASWDAWRRADSGPSPRDPAIVLGLEMDQVTFNLRPSDLAALNNMKCSLKNVLNKEENRPPASPESARERFNPSRSGLNPNLSSDTRRSSSSMDGTEPGDHYYKDDLRSGAFKVLRSGQLPMAYQVILQRYAVSWRYPHPRAITRLVAFPLPGLDEEQECVLELYSRIHSRWEPHTYFKLPLSAPEEIHLYALPPEAVFSTIWRFRLCSSSAKYMPFEFNMTKFLPKQEFMLSESQPEPDGPKCPTSVTAEQLSSVLRVDSYFAPRLLPRTRLSVQLAALEVNLHNSLLDLCSQATDLEGYYLSKPLMRSHQVLRVTARDLAAHWHLGSPSGMLMLLNTQLSSDLLDCATGTMEKFVTNFRIQSGLSLLEGPQDNNPRLRFRTSAIKVALHLPRLKTLQALTVDWKTVLDEYLDAPPSESNIEASPAKVKTNREIAIAAAVTLEGRVSMWLHNSCSVALRVGQEGTDEVVPLGPGARLAYRWRNPMLTKRLHFAFASPAIDWHWSNSVSFSPGNSRVQLDDVEATGSNKASSLCMYVSVEQTGANRLMHLSGRLVLANMLRQGLLYTVRARYPSSNKWRPVTAGVLHSETVGRSVICGGNCEISFKIKLAIHDTGWSGDIPLKECPKQNVPWLVKIPSDGEVPYISVWCRVSRARSDSRILATVWPLFVLHSHLPLDTDVLITSETNFSTSDVTDLESGPLPPVIQAAPGRGACIHLHAPGTTSARHTLSFQYRNLECPVTPEAVHLHYGVTETSVFDKPTPINNIDEVTKEILTWLDRSGAGATSTWPYSIVTHHWPGTWQPALLQPRCDVTVRYQAVRAGGGCCLDVQLSPVVLLCNASPIALTLRAHDAAPLCKLEPGVALSPPSAVIKKPFFLSVEMGRETFVSSQLEVCSADPGRYGAPPPGQVAIDHHTTFALQCNQKVAMLSMHYEIKEDIHVLGITSAFMFINRLTTNIMVSTLVLPDDLEKEVFLRPKTYKMVPPTKEKSIHGIPLCRFWLGERWRGGDASELHPFLCVALPTDALATNAPAPAPVPVRLGVPPFRRALALLDNNKKSVPVVITQYQNEGRWLVSMAPDPCPQFLVHNRTQTALAIAQPPEEENDDGEPSASINKAVVECPRVRWWCTLQPGAVSHYTSPAHSARHPPPTPAPAPCHVPFLTFARIKEDADLEWCSPIAACDGEQLVQLDHGVTLKLRVRTHPHSTLIELQDVDQRDISARDIRQRLLRPIYSEQNYGGIKTEKATVSQNDHLERIAADEKLLEGEKKQVFQLYSETDLTPVNNIVDLTELSPKKPELSKPEAITSDKAAVPTVDVSDAVNPDLSLSGPSDNDPSVMTFMKVDESSESCSIYHPGDDDSGWNETTYLEAEWIRGVVESIAVEVAAANDTGPLLSLHVDRAAVLKVSRGLKTMTTLSIADVQIDNLQHDTGLYDFAVVATTRAEMQTADRWPALWNMFAERAAFATKQNDARLVLKTCHEKWNVVTYTYKELTEVDLKVGPLSLYVEDAYVKALAELYRLAMPLEDTCAAENALAEEQALQTPLRLELFYIHPLDLTLTLHTAMRVYIALDQSPLHLSEFKMTNMMTTSEHLTHALTVHYLSAALLGAGWVVGGLEILGAPGALVARVGGATGGVRGIASAAAAALLRSLSAWAGSLARNLDILAGDEEHSLRAAAARRRLPDSFVAGLYAGITNFAINMLGAVGGLAHHPLVGVAVGESGGGATALRRGLVGAITKPLSATADLVALAGHGLLRQTGWDPVPQPRSTWVRREPAPAGWRRDCVRWAFRLAELRALAGFEVMLDNAPLQLLLTHKFLVVADFETEQIVEMIDLQYCTLGPYQGSIIELCVTQRRSTKSAVSLAVDEDDEFKVSAAAMARVARYTGAAEASAGAGACAGADAARVLRLQAAPRQAPALHAALAAAVHHNADTHFALL